MILGFVLVLTRIICTLFSFRTTLAINLLYHIFGLEVVYKMHTINVIVEKNIQTSAIANNIFAIKMNLKRLLFVNSKLSVICSSVFPSFCSCILLSYNCSEVSLSNNSCFMISNDGKVFILYRHCASVAQPRLDNKKRLVVPEIAKANRFHFGLSSSNTTGRAV